MSVPTPVTTSIIVVASASTFSAMGISNTPILSRSHSMTSPPSGMLSNVASVPTATPNDSAAAPQAKMPIHFSPSLRPKTRLVSRPRIGKARISGTNPKGFMRSPLQLAQVVHFDRVPGSEDGDDQRQPNRDLCGGDGDAEEHEDLSVQLPEGARESDEEDVGRVEHQLDAHEHHDRVATDQHADHARGEQQGAEQDRVCQRDHRVFSLRVSTTAPTMATRSRIEITSKGNTYWLNNTWPIASGLPKSGPTSTGAGVRSSSEAR